MLRHSTRQDGCTVDMSLPDELRRHAQSWTPLWDYEAPMKVIAKAINTPNANGHV